MGWPGLRAAVQHHGPGLRPGSGDAPGRLRHFCRPLQVGGAPVPGPEPDRFYRPDRRGLSGIEPCGGEPEQVRAGIGAGEQPLDAPGVAQHHGADLQQPQPDRAGTGAGQFGAGQGLDADGVQQRIGQRGQQ